MANGTSGLRFVVRSILPFVPFAAVGAALLIPAGDIRHVGQCIVGFVLLLLGGNWLVEGAIVIAKRMGWSPLLIGLTIVAFGTSAPELVFNIIAAGNNNTELSFGNIVGSNIANIGLVLGVSALVSPLIVSSRVIRNELPWLIGVSIVFTVLALAPPQVRVLDHPTPGWPRWTGILLLVMFAGFIMAWYRMARSERRDKLAEDLVATVEEEAAEVDSLPLALFLFLVGLAMLIGGGWMAEKGAVGVARWFGLSQAIIGLTVVALATSLPEIATSAIAAAKGHKDMALGNVVGSNLFNIMLVMGMTAAIRPVPMPLPWGWWDLGVMIAMTIVLLPIVALHQKRINRYEGAFLVLCYLGYITFGVVRELQ